MTGDHITSLSMRRARHKHTDIQNRINLRFLSSNQFLYREKCVFGNTEATELTVLGFLFKPNTTNRSLHNMSQLNTSY